MKSATRFPAPWITSLRLLASILFFLFFAATRPVSKVQALTKAAGITSVSPHQVVAGMVQAVEIHGEGLSGAQVSLELLPAGEPFQVEQVEPASPQLLRVRPPRDIQPGKYRLCVNLPGLRDCDRSFEVLAFEASVQVIPQRLFNQRQQTIVISGTDPGAWKRLVLKGPGPQRELVFRKTTRDKQPALAADIGPGLPAGRYHLLLFRDGEDQGHSTAPIEVSGPLTAPIKRVVPQRIRRYRSGKITVRIDGEGLGEVTSATLLGEEGCQQPNGAVCRLLSRSNRQLVFEIEPSVKGSLGGSNILVLADGSEVPLSGFGFLEPIVPWGRESWSAFVVILLLASSLVTAGIGLNLDSYEMEQTAPGFRDLAVLLSLALLAGLVISLLVALFWGAFTEGFKGINLPFLGTTTLLGLDLGLAFGFALIRSNLDPKHRGSRWPYLSAAAMALLGLGGLFVLDAQDLLRWALPGEAGLLGLIFLSGGAETVRARRRLDRQRALAASERAVAGAVELGLYRNGRVSIKDLPEAPRHRVLQAMVTYWTEHRASRSLSYSEFEGMLAYDRWQGIQEFAQAFEAARPASQQAQDWQERASKLVNRLAKEFPFVIEAHPSFPTPRGPFVVLRATPVLLESVLPSPFPILALSAPRIEEKQFQQLQRILNELDATSRFALLISLHPGRAVREQIAKRLGGLGRENLVVLDERDCLEILMGKDEVRGELMKVIQQQADISVFSPYHSVGPTTAEMFFGRELEVRAVLNTINHNSVSVLGARRVGKTSMVRTIQRLLEEQGKLLFYLDCYHIGTYEEFFQEISNRWQLPGIDVSSWRSPLDFPRLVLEIEGRNPGRSLIFLMDEIDRLLAWDSTGGRDEKLFRLLRSLSQEKRCQFVFSGERTILDRRENPSSAFFNFGIPIQLGLLDRETSARLLYEPMSLVGVVLENREALLSLVYDRTSGHPNLIQFLCEESLKELSRVHTRALNPEQMLRIAEDTAYRDWYVHTFWSQATPLERAISICLAEEGEGTGEEILNRLQGAGFSCSLTEVERGFRYLGLNQLLATQGGRYLLRPRLFASFARSMYTYGSWKNSLLQDWESERTDERAFG